jgi:hypothetical protein
VNVPKDKDITVSMAFDGWAFEKVIGVPRNEGLAGGF